MAKAGKRIPRATGGSTAPRGSIVVQGPHIRSLKEGAAAKITLKQGAWRGVASRKRALEKVLTGFGEAVRRSEERGEGVRLTLVIDPNREAPQIEIEDVGASPASTRQDDFEAALAEARARGAQRAAEILVAPDMLSADAFADLIGVSRETVRQKRRRHEVLGLEGAKRGARFPRWQVTQDGELLPALPRLFDLLGGNSWTVYRFLVQHHPELDGASAVDGLKAGRVTEVLAAARNAGRAFS